MNIIIQGTYFSEKTIGGYMKKFLILGFMFLSMGVLAAPILETGDYGVSLRNRNGDVMNCTLNIFNNTEEGFLVLNILDCPPQVIDVVLHEYDNGDIFVSEKIPATTRRGGYKLYEIKPLSSTSFEMTSHREYGDGGVGRPRSIVANLK